jgi:hypothetical protein
MAIGNNAKEVTAERIFSELKKLRGASLFKDLLLLIVPLLVAGLSIYFSDQNDF